MAHVCKRFFEEKKSPFAALNGTCAFIKKLVRKKIKNHQKE